MAIDLNCDLGEGWGQDSAIMPYITSANIACGAHVGDEATMRKTAALAMRHGVAIGAHPGYADREHFGRRELALSPNEIHVLVTEQIRALKACAQVVHVKPHGALYNLAARDDVTAAAVVAAVKDCGPDLILIGLAGGALVRVGEACGLRVANEGFADRTYQADGSLTPRSHVGAVLADKATVLAQALCLVRDGGVRATDGSWVPLRVETLCLHGDGPHAVALARSLHEGLKAAGVTLRALGR